MKKFIALSLLCAAATAVMAEPYKVIAPIHNAEDGHTAYLLNFDTGEKIDSAVIANASVTFLGEIDEPIVARITADGNRQGDFILEQGTIAISPKEHRAVGSMLNDIMNAYSDSVAALSQKFQEAATEDEQRAIYDQYLDLSRRTMAENMDSPIGYYLFLDNASSIQDPQELIATIDKYPSLKSYKRVEKLIDSANSRINTSAGKPFVDFEVTYDGTTKHLSDYVGKGQYVLVDFWASWCGPCIAELPYIKTIYNKYKDTNKLKVLGVAVWDEPANTVRAISQHDIPWEVMINGQYAPTDAYGISGIPCIILFGPDGTIINRDARGEQLVNLVDQVLAN